MSASDSGRLELVATGFSFPTSLTFDEKGTTYEPKRVFRSVERDQAVASGGSTMMAIGRFWPTDYDIRSTVLPTIGVVSMFQKGVIPEGSAGSTSMGSKRSS